MESGPEIKLIKEFYRDEVTDREFYRRLSVRIKNDKIKKSLKHLSEVEDYHADYWASRLSMLGQESKQLFPYRFKLVLLLFVTRIIGLNLTINLMERGEVESIIKYREFLKRINDSELAEGLNRIIEDEISHENLFNDMNERREKFLDRIQSFIYGMSDGLVEVLAAIAGLTAIIQNNFIIAMSGLVIGIGGTISMMLGAYLSKASESEFRISTIKREMLVDETVEGSKKSEINAQAGRSKDSAVTTGLSYVFGAIFPIAPFLFPLGFLSLLIAVALVAIVQAISNGLIAIALNTSILKSSSRAALLSLLAATITFLVGFVFHTYFHLYIT
ncbi:MAG: VIT1/CCC1 family protein [Candidatus Thermoplasmatota archaeon]|jgi:predicted membrane protein (TIGR00267 family)|nr:VIT1/CCC1 family protein [Candidatus Thermoplasmatota archaeon]